MGCDHSAEQPKSELNNLQGNTGSAAGGSLGGYPYVYPSVCPTCNRCPTCGNYKFPFYPQPYVTYNLAGQGQHLQ